jgi:hypothetical protein
MKYEVRKRIMQADVPILAYAQTPGIASCQTKMMLGKHCGEAVEISQAELQEAVRRVRYDMKFIGLTEEAEASARLFLAMHPFPFASGSPASQFDPVSANMTEVMVSVIHQHTRTNHAHTLELNAKLRLDLTTHQWVDTNDEAIYREAVAVFYERCGRYGIRTKNVRKALLAKIS